MSITKKELIKLMEPLDDDAEVFVSQSYGREAQDINRVTIDLGEQAVIFDEEPGYGEEDLPGKKQPPKDPWSGV